MKFTTQSMKQKSLQLSLLCEIEAFLTLYDMSMKAQQSTSFSCRAIRGKQKDCFITFLSLTSPGWHMMKQFYDIKPEQILCVHASDIFSAFDHKLMDKLLPDLTFIFTLFFRGIIGADNNVIHRVFGINL